LAANKNTSSKLTANIAFNEPETLNKDIFADEENKIVL
jgi:hypothetical protein